MTYIMNSSKNGRKKLEFFLSNRMVLLFALLLLVSGNGMADGLEGAFIWPGWYVNWNQARWSEELGMMQDVGMDTLIITYSVNETSAYYPTVVPGLSIVASESIERILSAADARGMDVYLGLVLQNEWWSNTSEAYLDGLAALSTGVATELYSLYSSHGCLKGFYLPQEIDNCRWADSAMRQRLVDHLLKPVSDHIHSLDEDLVFCEAPFYNPTCLQPVEYEQWWIDTLQAAPHFDLVIPQDGIAAQPSRITLSVIEDYFTALKAACDATGRTLWADLEVFEQVGVPHPPATPERILNQIAVEEPLVEKIVIWEWYYIAPHHSVRALDFNNNYQQYRQGKKLLENVSQAQSYTLTPPPGAPYLDPGGEKLTDGTAEYDFTTHVGWNSVSSARVLLDLGSEYSHLYNFRAYFLRDNASGIALPSSVSVSLSADGMTYTPAGSLEPVALDNQSVNPYQILLSTPVSGRYARFDITPGAGSWTFCSEVSAYSSVLDLISMGKPYVFSLQPSGAYPDSGGELTNDEWPFSWDAQVGWESPSGTVEVTIDLEDSFTLGKVESYFMRSESAAVRLPQSVAVSVSHDGINFNALGSLLQESAQDEAVNLYASRVGGAGGRYVRIEISPEAGWLMLSEIRIFGEPVLSVPDWRIY
jgi:hypothetical protein